MERKGREGRKEMRPCVRSWRSLSRRTAHAVIG